MKKILLGVLLLSQLASAQNHSKVYINIVQNATEEFEDRFYIVFSSHDSYHDKDPNLNSVAGHAWVQWVWEDRDKRTKDMVAFGFWPNYSVMKSVTSDNITNLLVANTIVEGSVPGILREDIYNPVYSNTLKQVIVTVDRATFVKSMEVVAKYQLENPQYSLLSNDCVTFFIEVGKSIGFNMPERQVLSPKSWYPSDYMDLFVKYLTSQNMPGDYIPLGAAQLTVMIDGSSMLKFKDDEINFSNRYSNGDVKEIKYRNGRITSERTLFKNGDSWYQQPQAGRNPISQYQFANGNLISDYDPLTFDPRNVILQLRSPNKYNGSINEKGEPHGKGVFHEFVYPGETVTKNGDFINGKFVSFSPVRQGNAIVSGRYKNGKLNGEVKIEYDDGRVYIGNFVDDFANGKGVATSKSGDFQISGDFKNGFPDGYCLIKNPNGLYKGEIKKGVCTGDGTWWSKNGNTYDGKFEADKFISGKVTLPNGDYYIGTFDANGSPKDGNFYDKNGNEKRSGGGNNEGGAGSNNAGEKKGDTDCMVCGPVGGGKVDCWNQ